MALKKKLSCLPLKNVCLAFQSEFKCKWFSLSSRVLNYQTVSGWKLYTAYHTTPEAKGAIYEEGFEMNENVKIWISYRILLSLKHGHQP